MQKTHMRNLAYHIVTIFLLLPSFCIADDAPTCLVPGGLVKPIENTDIQMHSETIDITLFPTYYTVEVNYKFINLGEEQVVTMGFPSSSNSDMKFKAFENGNELEITKIKSDWDYKPKTRGLGCDFIGNPINQFECHTVSFSKGETKYIKNTYEQKYNLIYDNMSFISFSYILVTGAFWKDKITSIKVRVNTDNAPISFDLAGGSYLNNTKVDLRNFQKEYKDIKPTEDLNFSIEYKDEYIPSTKNPVLESAGSINYSVTNLSDNNINTAWVEGSIDSGIGNVIRFYNPSGNKYKVTSLSIVNGYAKNETTFKENNRVSCIKVTVIHDYAPNTAKSVVLDGGYYWGINDFYEGKVISDITYIFTLEDTPKKQEIIFDYPILTSSLSIEILEVHKGTKYDDTAITELKLNYEKETTNR